MDRILTGNQRLLRNLNNNVILNSIRTNAPAIKTYLTLVNDSILQKISFILVYLEDTKLIVNFMTPHFSFSRISASCKSKKDGKNCLRNFFLFVKKRIHPLFANPKFLLILHFSFSITSVAFTRPIHLMNRFRVNPLIKNNLPYRLIYN